MITSFACWQPAFAVVLNLPMLGLAAVHWATLATLYLPAAAALTVVFLTWHRYSQKMKKLSEELSLARQQRQQCQRERDLAQEEVFRRLSEERELNTQKTQFQAQLAEYERCASLARLALGAAHEINNPLLGILSHLELELRATTDPDQRAEIVQCIAGTRRISATLHGLVDYARPGPLVLSKVNLRALAADTLKFLENQSMLHGRHLENEVPPDLPLIYADANQLSQILLNLLLNAAEATPEGGHITVSANKLAYVDSVEIRVSDTGCGIPADVLQHVFQPFFTTKGGKGTGLGLSISQAYVSSHKGEIRADSVVNHGTTITITLPLQPADANSRVPEESGVVT